MLFYVFVALGSPVFDVQEITESTINVTWAPAANTGAHVVYYVEFRKEGKLLIF